MPTLPDVLVGTKTVIFSLYGRQFKSLLPANAKKFIAAFDRGKKVRPIKFRLALPQYNVKSKAHAT